MWVVVGGVLLNGCLKGIRHVSRLAWCVSQGQGWAVMPEGSVEDARLKAKAAGHEQVEQVYVGHHKTMSVNRLSPHTFPHAGHHLHCILPRPFIALPRSHRMHHTSPISRCMHCTQVWFP